VLLHEVEQIPLAQVYVYSLDLPPKLPPSVVAGSFHREPGMVVQIQVPMQVSK
jgi:hypothetical protein